MTYIRKVELKLGNPIVVGYGTNILKVCAIRPYLTKAGKYHPYNIRIIPAGGGIRAKPTQKPPKSVRVRLTESDGTPTNFDKRIETTCIEVEVD